MNEVMKKWGLITESHSRDHVRIIWVNSQNYFLLSSFVVYSKSFKKTIKDQFLTGGINLFLIFLLCFFFFSLWHNLSNKGGKSSRVAVMWKREKLHYILIPTYLNLFRHFNTSKKKLWNLCAEFSRREFKLSTLPWHPLIEPFMFKRLM